MANPDTTPTDPPQVEVHTAARTGSDIRTQLAAVAFVLVVVLAECAVAVLVFPSADDTTAMTQAMLATKPDQTSQPPAPPDAVKPDEKEEKEVDLGEYDVSSYQPLSDTTLRISVHLYGTVLSENENEVTALLETKKQRMREQVLVILRSAELTDLTDAGLGLIKRRILEKTNRIFGKPLLQQVIFSEFSFLEQ